MRHIKYARILKRKSKLFVKKVISLIFALIFYLRVKRAFMARKKKLTFLITRLIKFKMQLRIKEKLKKVKFMAFKI